MTIDRKLIREFQKDAEEAIRAVCEKHGVTAEFGRGRFTSDNATLKLEVSAISDSGEVLTKEAQAFKANAHRYGLRPDDLGGTFTTPRGTYKITGLVTRRPKYPISAEKVGSGGSYKFPASTVVSAGVTPPGGVGRRAAIRAQKGTGLTPEIKSRFVDLACQLSPENLTCDGELSRTQVAARRRTIMREWRELEAQAGTTVSESDAWGFEVQR